MSLSPKLRYLFFAAMLLPLQSCAFYYKAEPIEAWVVDAETKQPLEGVIVVAHWQLKGGLEGGNPVGQMMIMETVTDAKGRFYFPGWGPKLRSLRGDIKDQSPGILLFKSGHKYRGLQNKTTNKTIRGDLDLPLKSDWDKKMIELQRFKGTTEEYANHIHSLDNDLEWARYGENCEWKQVPVMLVALHRMSESFSSQGVKLRGWQIGATIRKVTEVGNQKRCGSADDFFRKYLS